MWALANADRSIVGEHYTSVGEFFRIQRQRPFNAAYRELGDSEICGEFDTDEEHVAIRVCTSWATREEEIVALEEAIAAL